MERATVEDESRGEDEEWEGTDDEEDGEAGDAVGGSGEKQDLAVGELGGEEGLKDELVACPGDAEYRHIEKAQAKFPCAKYEQEGANFDSGTETSESELSTWQGQSKH